MMPKKEEREFSIFARNIRKTRKTYQRVNPFFWFTVQFFELTPPKLVS